MVECCFDQCFNPSLPILFIWDPTSEHSDFRVFVILRYGPEAFFSCH